MRRIYILSLILVSSCSIATGQTFRAAIVGGLNASQINGDLIAGFDKLGIHGGLKVVADLRDRLEGSIELLYSERGSRASGRFVDPFSIRINYVEIPLTIAYKDWIREDHYRLRFEGGLSIGRLLKAEQEDVTGTRVLDEYQDTDISWLVGATFFTNEDLAFSARYSQSINFLLSQNLPTGFTRMRGFFLTFRIMYFL
ncbi:MAG: PorT family protein [Saprospiraceae bacterium]|nr:PorT family protein [Saprospiraceae bacterium]